MKTLDRKKTISITVITVVALSVTTLCTPSFAGATTKKVHMAGRPTSTSANTIRNGKGAPSNSLGVDGDFYIDISKLDFYGPKLNGHWPAPVSLRGPAGTNGSNGVNGTNGKSGTNGVDGKNGAVGEKGASSGIVGPIGPTGPQGIAGPIGPVGLTGPTGLTGDPGATGPAGPAGASGPAGSNGSPGASGAQGATGSQGLQGLIGLTGPTGATGLTGPAGTNGSQGIQGVQGVQGATGATGPSQVQVVSIGSWQLSTSTAGTGNTSSAFGNLAPSKSYQFILGINGKLATSQPPTYAIKVGLTVQCSDPGATLTYTVSSSFGYSNDGDAVTYSKESFTVIGTLSTTSANPTSTLSVTAIDSGTTTGLDAMNLSGSAFIQLVGSLT
jgi:hypothetical protein